MSSRFTLRYLPVIALLAMVVAGCVEPLRPLDPRSDGASYLPIAVYVPSAPATKASGGLVASKTAESTLYDLEIWAFTHQAPGETKYDDEGAVAYLCLPSISASAFDDKGELDVSLRIPDYVMSRPDSLMRFDFYFLANGSSVGIDLSSTATAKLSRGALKRKVFGDSDGSGFGGSIVMAVPDGSVEGKGAGLPMSCFFNNGGMGFDLTFLKFDFTADQLTYVKRHHGQAYDEDDSDFIALGLTTAQINYLKSHCVSAGVWNWFSLSPSVTLTRAVSKLRFVFAKTRGLMETQIVSVELVDYNDESYVIPSQSYLFPRETDPEDFALPGNDYVKVSMGSSRLPLLLNDDIKEDPNPVRLRGTSTIEDPYFGQPASMSAQQYDNFLTAWIGKDIETEKLLYLRETDKPIKGRIHYKLGESYNTATFNMLGIGASNLHRNYSWTVYAYYSTDPRRLEVETYVLPWDDKLSGSIGVLNPVNVDQDGKLLVDPNTATVSNFRVEVPAAPGAAVARVVIYSPEGGQLLVTPKGDTEAFTVTITDKDGNTPPDIDKINRNRDGGEMYIRVARSASATSGKSMQLSFRIKLPSGRVISADSELIDDNYTFVIP